MLVDFHAHLNHPAFAKGIEKVVERMLAKNVIAINTGFNLEGNRKALEQCIEYPKSLRCAIGLSPNDVVKADVEKELAFVEENAEKAIAIGEIGLDFYYYKKTEEQKAQEKFFLQQLELAEKFEKPVVVHSREAEETAIDILSSFKMPRVLHFWLEPKLLTKAIDAGLYVSIPTFKCKEQKKLFRNAPLERVFLETDSPYGLNSSERNEPANVIVSYVRLAEIKKMPLKEVEVSIYENYRKIAKV